MGRAFCSGCGCDVVKARQIGQHQERAQAHLEREELDQALSETESALLLDATHEQARSLKDGVQERQARHAAARARVAECLAQKDFAGAQMADSAASRIG